MTDYESKVSEYEALRRRAMETSEPIFTAAQPPTVYIVVTHKPTGRRFAMDRRYTYIEATEAEMDAAAAKNVDDWDGWKPTHKYQMPVWAYDLDKEEFIAVWAF